MPQKYSVRLHIMRVYAICEVITYLVVVILCLVGIAVLIKKYSVLIALVCFLVAGTAIFLLTILKNNSFKEKGICSEPYILQIPDADTNSILRRLSACPLEDHTFVSFCHHQNMKIRLLLQLYEEYSSDLVKSTRKRANRKINQQFGINHEVSFYETLSMLRINLVITQTYDANLSKWVQKNASMLLCRGEAIINAGIVLDQRIMILPAIFESLSVMELPKYRCGMDFLATVFTSEETYS